MSRNDIKEEGTLMEKKLQNIELGGKAAILDKAGSGFCFYTAETIFAIITAYRPSVTHLPLPLIGRFDTLCFAKYSATCLFCSPVIG